MRRASFMVVAVFLALAAGLLIVEATLYAFPSLLKISYMQWEPDGHIRGRGVPGSSFLLPDGETKVRFNKLGFRGPEVSADPPKNTLRIIALGGSAVFNVSLKHTDTWPYQLQQALCKLGVTAEVINLGMPGYNSQTSKINYQVTGRYLKPHAAIFYHTWNDLQAYQKLKSPGLLFAKPSASKGQLAALSFWKRAILQTRTGRVFMHHIYLPYIAPMKKRIVEGPQNSAAALSESLPDQRAFAWTRRNYRDFITLSKQDGVLPILVSQATLAGSTDPQAQNAVELGRTGMTMPAVAETWSKMRDLIQSTAQESRSIYVDGFSHVPQSLDYLSDHVHFRAKGAKSLATGVASDLVTNPRFKTLVNQTTAGRC